eukprot:TRINITY_DN6396_c0_g1_i3.p1 TRINITY_DN6396_c0_g1~~TRINITY_DN6396_c0_g1_i3.p1  ORF type:complete len:395 (+),score=82.95 TRINITY_DN6396_c0_g1_i3:158-1342(+)
MMARSLLFSALSIYLAVPSLPIPVTETFQCPEHATARKSHCICDDGFVCHELDSTAKCLTGKKPGDGQEISGFGQGCNACRCVAAGASQGGMSNRRPYPSRDGRQEIQQRNMQTAGRMQAEADSAIPMPTGPARPFAYLKLHKVGSTTASIALERVAAKHNLKLCGRADDFWGSLPCQAWTTHDTESVMAVQGVHGLKFMVGGSRAVAITLLRKPIDRLLSRYFYDLAMAGQKVTRPPTYEEFKVFLNQNPNEAVHYLRAFSGASLSVDAALQTLDDFDVVGVSEELDRFMTVTAAHLNVPVTDLVYKNEKVVLGKPKYEDLEPRLQTLLQQVTKDDETIYQHAKTVFIAQQQVVPRFGDKLKLFQSAQARIDQRCTFKETRSQVLTGLDCYRI